MFRRIQDAVQLLNQDYIRSFTVQLETRTQNLQKICCFLEETCRLENTMFVCGRGKRKSRNQKYLEPVSYTHLDVYKRQLQCRMH